MSLRNLDQASHLDDPARKQGYVTTMFEEIAPRYDRFTRWFSYGMDKAWKAELVAATAQHAPPGAARGLDLACGTGDLAVSLAEAIPNLSIEGIDVASGMVERGRPHPRVSYRVGDAMRLDAADGSMQVVSMGYGLRNFPDHRAALVETARVLQPGGVLGVLEFTRPGCHPWRWIYLSYLWLAGTIYGLLWHRHGPTYSYLAASVSRFVSRRQLLTDIDAAGLTPVHLTSRLAAGMVIIVAVKR